MGRKKKYIKGKVYLINDSLLVKNTKNNRRIVALNNDKENMHVRRIISLYDKNGNRKNKVIPIEKYPDLKKDSGIENKTFRKTIKGEPIKERFLRKTKTRLNKWDLKKIFRK